MTHSRVARRYAAALMGAAEETRVAEAVTRDLQLVTETLRSSRDLRLLVASPIIRAGKKASVFKALFSSRVSPQTMVFIDLLIAKQREELLEDTIREYMALRDKMLGIVNIRVVSAVELTKPQVDALQAQLERYTGKKVRMHLLLDPAIKGGLVVRVGDTVLDASVRHQLEVLGERFAHGEYASARAAV